MGSFGTGQRVVVVVPGFFRTPKWYAGLARGLGPLGAVFTHCPPGCAERRGVSMGHSLDALAADLVGELGAWAAKQGMAAPMPVAVVGHSWGCHIARTFVVNHAPGARLFEIDPRLRQVPQNAAEIENHPDGFANREELVAAHAAHSVGEADIDWDRWEEDGGGGYRLAFSKAQLLRHFMAAYDEPDRAWGLLAKSGAAKPVVMRTMGFSLNGEELWRAAGASGLVRVEELEGIFHDLRAGEQEFVAQRIVELVRAVPGQ